MPCTAFVLHTSVVSLAPVLVLKETPVGQLIVNAFVPHVEYKLPSTISSPFLVLAREGKFIVIAPPPVQMPYLLLETSTVPLVSLRYAPLFKLSKFILAGEAMPITQSVPADPSAKST